MLTEYEKKFRMAEIVPPGTSGIARVEHFEVDEAGAKFNNLRAQIHRDFASMIEVGRYARLTVDGGLMMTDTQYEWRTNREFLLRAKGRVLVAGLGLGMILHPLAEKAGVTEITVVEKYPDVVALVAGTLPETSTGLSHAPIKVVAADIFEWNPLRGEKFDTIYFDIWPNVCSDNWADMKKLKARFRSRLAKGGWMGAWEEEDVRYRYRHGG